MAGGGASMPRGAWPGGGLCVVGDVHGRGGMRDGGVHDGGHVWQGGVHGMHVTPLVDRKTDACKNITLPLTSFAGGKNLYKSSLLCLEASYSNVCII